MRMILASLLLATTAFTTARAAEFTPRTRIDAVTVYPRGADIVREVLVDVPAGEHSLILADLPQNVDPQSIRVEGAASGTVLVASVDTRNRFLSSQTQDAMRKKISDEIVNLQFERQGLDQTVNDLHAQRNLLTSLADKQLVPQSTTEALKPIDAMQLGALVELVGQRLALLSKDILAAQKRQRDIDVRLSELSQQLNELAPSADSRTEVVLNVEARQATKGALRVSYRVQEAGWTPFYDARLSIGDDNAKPALELVHRADVTQSTSESWNDVKLTLSTARPGGTTAAPDVAEWEVRRLEPAPSPVVAAPEASMDNQMHLADEAQNAARTKSRQPALAKPTTVVQKQAEIETAGFHANYAIAGRVTIDNAGQSKKVRITSGSVEVALQAITAPRVDPVAYLTASFKVQGRGPQLPGIVNLFRDGVYVGQGNLPLLTPTEDAKLGFGVDDLIKVTRNEVKRVSGEEGLLTSANVDERAWDIKVRNLHTVSMQVRVVDRVPFTAAKDITITETAGMTPPTIRDLDKKRGVLAWDVTLEPQAESTVKTGYKISWPEGIEVSVVD